MREQIFLECKENEILPISVEENIAYSSLPYINYEKVREVVKRVGLEGTVNKLKGAFKAILLTKDISLSSGELAKIKWARALYMEPKILLLGETLANIDEKGQQQIMQVLQNLRKEMTIVLVTHNNLGEYVDKTIKL